MQVWLSGFWPSNTWLPDHILGILVFILRVALCRVWCGVPVRSQHHQAVHLYTVCIASCNTRACSGRQCDWLAGERANEEREQALNQLLSEMDGFTPEEGIVFVAATNRADLLDPALMRAGRFDRKIRLNRPDAAAREEILKVGVSDKTLRSLDSGLCLPGAAAV